MASFNLGRLTLDLVAKTADFIRGMNAAERKAEETKKRIKQALSDLRSAANTAGKALSGMIKSGLSYGFKEIIKNTVELEKGQAQLAAVLKSTGNVAGFTQDQLNEMGAALADASTFDTGSITKAQTTLLAFSGIVGDKLVKAQQAAADMAARMGMDISSAAETIGRALDVPSQGMAALSRQGFKFSEEQKQLIKWLEETGRTAEAQDIILSALEESYDGAAKAARDTFGGALTAVQNNISNLLEGENGSLDGAKAALEEFNKVLTDPKTKEEFAKIAQGVIEFATALISHLDTVVKAFEVLKRGFAHVADGIIIGVEAVKEAFSDFSVLDATPFGLAKRALKDFNQETDKTTVKYQSFSALMERWNKPYSWELPKLPELPAANDDNKSETQTGSGKTEEQLAAEFELDQARKKREEAAKKAAEAAAKIHERQQEAINKEISALQRAAHVWGMNEKEVKLYDLAVQGANKSQLEQAANQLAIVEKLEQEQTTRENYLHLVENLKTEEERRKEVLQEQLALIKEMEQLTGESDKETFKRAAFGSFDESAPADKYKDEKSVWEKLDEDTKAQQDWYAQQLELLNEYREQRQDLTDEWDEKEKELKTQHEEGLKAIQSAKWNEALDAASGFFKGLTGLQESESKKARAIGKAAAIAQTTIDTYKGAVAAYTGMLTIPIVGVALGAVAAAAVVAMGMQNIAKIRGVAHSGIDSVPQTGTWLLEKGERVTTAKTSAKLDATLERIGRQQREQGRGERSRGRSAVINQTIQVTGTIDGRTSNQLAAESERAQRVANARFGY